MKPSDLYRVVVLSLFALVMLASATAVLGQEERSEEQQQEIMSLAKIVGAVIEGEVIPSDDTLGWSHDFLKSSDQTTFVPFTLSVGQSDLSTSTVALYLYVVPQSDPAAEPPAETDEPVEPTFEDGVHVSLDAPNENGVYEIRRGFFAPAGEYDVYVSLGESAVPDGTEAKTMVIRQAVSVPDLWNDQLATSTVMETVRIDSLTEPMPPDQMLANPYTLGTMRIVPKIESAYLTTDELSLVFLVYNCGLMEGKPDVSIGYEFNTRGPTGDEYFNRTNPQVFNGQTLPPQFDMTAGHQLVAGQAIPLGGFPPADYRLVITVTDNTSGTSLVHNVDFSVSAS